MLPSDETRLFDFAAIIHNRCLGGFLAGVLAGVAAVHASAEIVFQDFFTQPAGNVTNSVPWIDVEGN